MLFRSEDLVPLRRTVRTYVFEGGCVIYKYDLGAKPDPSLIFAAGQALDFVPRKSLVNAVAARTHGLSLCGADAPPCKDGR